MIMSELQRKSLVIEHRITCPNCKDEFTTRVSLEELLLRTLHLVLEHEPPRIAFTCPHCEYVMTKQVILEATIV